jgi:hypothetical protein
MTTALRLPRFACSVSSLLLATGLSLLAPAASTLEVPIDQGTYFGVHEALGISDDFGRWNKTIRVVYDPDGAPAAYSSTKVLALLAETFSYWTTVSGVRFQIEGINAAAPDDRDVSNPSSRDGIVRVSWGAIGDAAGRAGPLGGFFDDDLGYFPYEDGTIELNNGTDVIENDFDLVNVLVHEVGHLIGLGHSDNPDSVMYANPYNFLRYPREDDIRAVQVLYGPPAAAIDVDNPIPAWVYTPPPQASAATTQFLFKPNSHPSSGSGAYFRVGSSTVTSITSSTADNQFVNFAAGVGGSTSAINVAATFIVVDPAGYMYSKRDWTLNCNANSSCVEFMSLTETQIMKTIPGTWKVYVVNEATNQTLASATIPVNTTVSFNRPPTATITAAAGSTPARANFTITATDPDGDAIEVVWHPPGLIGFDTDVRSTFASGGSASLSANFSLTGTYSFFVEVRDNRPRYGDGADSSAAGDGFQTLMKVTVTLPAAAIQVATTAETTTTVPSTAPSQSVLSAVAKTSISLLVQNLNGSNAVSLANVGFKLGASTDQGATTKTSFGTGDSVIIAGSVQPQPADVGKAANIYIVVRTTIAGADRWTYLDGTSGLYVDWPTVTVSQLKPAYSVSSLQASEAFLVYSGKLTAAQHRIYIGYRLSSGSIFFYTGQALSITAN